MSKDQLYYIYLLIFLTSLPLVFHALRARITLGSFFGLAGVYSIMLWQFLQAGWWVSFGEMNFNAGLTLFIPPILLGSLLTFVFDGLRTTKSYVAMVTMTSIAAWLFSVFREMLATYTPLPYLIVLSNREHLAIIIALLISQLVGMTTYHLTRAKVIFPLRLPIALLSSVIGWLALYSVLNFGLRMGITNLANEIPAFVLSSTLAIVAVVVYGAIASTIGMVMPERSIKSLLSIWRLSEPDLSKNEDEISNRDTVISELQLLNRKLKTNSRLMEYHMEHATYGILITNSLGKISQANQPAHELLHERQLVDLNLEKIICRELGEEISFQDIVTEDSGKKWKMHGANDDTCWYEIIATPLKDSDSRATTGFYFLVKDVTASIQAETRKLATHRVRDLNQTGRVLSHDFSNLLLGAEAQLRKIRDKASDRESVEAVNGISQAINHAREMLKQLGSGNQFGAPRLRIKRIGELISQAIDINRAAAAEAKITIVFQNNKSWCVEADRSQLVRVFTNLIKNAVRASFPNGQIEISVARRGSGIEIVIADEGQGMSTEGMEMAFDPGFSTKGEGKGGLGLAISYLMIDAHGGQLDLKKNPSGQGICAIVWLPEGRSHMELEEFSGKNVIVASDKPEKIQAMISELEEELGCYVGEAHNKEEVIALVKEGGAWDVLLIDEGLNPNEIRDAVGDKPDIKKISRLGQ